MERSLLLGCLAAGGRLAPNQRALILTARLI
jgi:hypothetical protein